MMNIQQCVLNVNCTSCCYMIPLWMQRLSCDQLESAWKLITRKVTWFPWKPFCSNTLVFRMLKLRGLVQQGGKTNQTCFSYLYRKTQPLLVTFCEERERTKLYPQQNDTHITSKSEWVQAYCSRTQPGGLEWEVEKHLAGDSQINISLHEGHLKTQVAGTSWDWSSSEFLNVLNNHVECPNILTSTDRLSKNIEFFCITMSTTASFHSACFPKIIWTSTTPWTD